MKLTWFGHAAYKLEIAGATILIDPFLSGNPVFPQYLSVEQVAGDATHVLLTHGHDDHVGDSLEILRNTGAQLTANFEICMWANAQGIQNINPMGAGGCVDVGPFKVGLTTAHHTSSTIPDNGQPIYLGNPNGIIVEAPNEPTLYHMGDTDIFSDMALVNELYAPKIGIVPIGDRFTMGARAAALACKRYFDFSTVLPCHYGTFPILDQNADGFIAAMGEQADRVKPLAPGESITV